MAPEAADGAQFDYRVVAKRKDYENLRLESAPDAYTDHYLYPDINDVPQQHRDKWISALPDEEQTRYR